MHQRVPQQSSPPDSCPIRLHDYFLGDAFCPDLCHSGRCNLGYQAIRKFDTSSKQLNEGVGQLSSDNSALGVLQTDGAHVGCVPLCWVSPFLRACFRMRELQNPEKQPFLCGHQLAEGRRSKEPLPFAGTTPWGARVLAASGHESSVADAHSVPPRLPAHFSPFCPSFIYLPEAV